jgi:hypothetical protein
MSGIEARDALDSRFQRLFSKPIFPGALPQVRPRRIRPVADLNERRPLALNKHAIYDRLRRSQSATIAGWRAINLSARPSNSFPGAILCHGDAPDG